MYKPSPNRIIVAVSGLLITLAVAGCANQSDTQSASNDYCKAGYALVCVERMGKVEECSCKSETVFKDIMSLP